MREIIVTKQDEGTRLDRLIEKTFPRLPSSLLQKSIRTRKIKLNGRRTLVGDRVTAGDVISLYVSEEFLDKPVSGGEWRMISRPRFTVCFENEHLLIVVKPVGMACQPDARETVDTLSNHVKAYCHITGQWIPEQSGAFAPALCNRIDRNTGGLVIAAKTAAALRDVNAAIRERLVEKRYLCIVHGKPVPESGKIEGYLKKNPVENRVYFLDSKTRGALYAATEYRTLRSCGEFSLLECRLITGRTHQIRAQMAHIGHPLVGDGKYGHLEVKGFTSQSLLSYSVTFNSGGGVLSELNGRTFKIDGADLVSDFERLRAGNV
ncbi:pseudouridine synthase [Clostridia bacterium]|nr:pseudouridine synthase [Clostridia bacterium]